MNNWGCDMKKRSLSRWALAGVVFLAIAVTAASQTPQRVQSTQLTVRTPVIADPLAEWEKQYAEAMKVVDELAKSGSPENAERLQKDLETLDSTLRRFVRVSERLRHKNRALADTMEFLALQNNIQQESRQYQTISNALTASHQAASNSIRNMK